MKHALWIHHVTICYTWIHPAFHLNYKTTQVLIVLKLSFFLNQKDNWIIPCFHQQMFSLNTMTMNCSYYKRSLMHQMPLDIYNCENQDGIPIHATNLSNTFALPQFMAQHNCEGQEPTDYPSTVPTASQASCDYTLKPKCAHNPIVSQCNQSQYLTLMKKHCVHSPSASQASQTNLSNSLVSQYPPNPGEHVLKRSATSTGEQEIPVQWFKLIHPSPKPRMTKTPFQIAVHVAYSPIASMNYKWTIYLHDRYLLL